MALASMGVEGSLRGVTRVEAEGRDLREALIGVGAEAPLLVEEERDPLVEVGEEAPVREDERDPLVGVGEEAPTEGERDERDPLVGVGEEAPLEGEGDERDSPVGVGDEAPIRDDPEDPTEDDDEDVCANSDLRFAFGTTQDITCQELALFRAKKQRTLCQTYDEISTHCPGVCKTAPRCSCFNTRSDFYLNKRKTYHCDTLKGMTAGVIQRKCRRQIIQVNCPSVCNPSSCAATSE